MTSSSQNELYNNLVSRRRFVDMTQELRACKADMLRGQILHEHKGNLLAEAMSALELFDLKMDAGVGAGTMYSVERAIDERLLPSPDALTMRETVLLIDELLCRQVEYLFGETLAESVLTFL